ncbi:MAG: hypothetical protein AAGI11_16825 [Pseudomonadota bacterium]
MKYISVEEGRELAGLRLVLTAGVPGPWGEAIKSIFAFKALPFAAVRQEAAGDNAALLEWTGQDSAPVAVLDDLPPVCHWLDQWMLAERMAPDKPLLPADPALAAEAIGVSALIAGVHGFGWNRRLQLMQPVLAMENPPPGFLHMGRKYGCTPEATAAATQRLQAICADLDARLARQAAAGSDYFVGAQATAADLYWAAFLVMIKPLPADLCPMDEGMRAIYSGADEATQGCISERLEQHRDMVYARHIQLPLDF